MSRITPTLLLFAGLALWVQAWPLPVLAQSPSDGEVHRVDPQSGPSVSSGSSASGTTGDFRKLTRHYVEGEGYDTTLESSYDACSRRCLNEDRCRMFEFYKPKRKCNLFDHTRARKTSDADAEVAIKP